MIKLVLILSLISNLAFADCQDPVTPVKAGTPAPCDGLLFTRSAEKINRQKLQQGDLAAKQVEVQKQELDLRDKQLSALTQAYQGETQRASVFQKQVLADADFINKREKSQKIESGLWFAGGVACTLLLTYIVSGTLRNATR